MKIQYIYCFLIFSFALNFQAQTSIKGTIVENTEEKKIIPNAVLITNQQRYFFSDFNGEFSFDLREDEKILKLVSKNYEVKNEFDSFSLIKLNPKASNDSSEIVDEVIDSVIENQMLPTNFSFRSLSKTTIKNSDVDFILRKDISFRLTKTKGLQEKNIAVSLDGLEGVVPKLVNKEIVSFNWFQSFVDVFGEQLLSSFGRLNKRNYQFHLIHKNESVKIVSFQPLRKGFQRSFEGVFIIDKSTSKFHKIQTTLDGEFRMNFITEFDLYSGLPKKTNLVIKPGKGGAELSFFGGGLSFGRIQKKNPKGDAKLEHEQVYYDIKAKDLISPFPEAFSKTSENKNIPYNYWSQFNFTFIDEDLHQVDVIKKYIEEENIKNKIKRISAFDAGYFPIGMINLDLTRLVKFNDYEGLRLGIGLQTNDLFSEKYRLGGFTAYGFKDEEFKYGFNGGVLLNSETSTWLNAFYDNDIEEVGMNNFLTDQRVYSLFEPRLVNITFFYKYEKYGLSLQHNFTPHLMTEFKVEKNRISQTRDYSFLNDGELFDNYDLTTAIFGLRWTPNYSYSKIGKSVYIDEENTPVISAQVSQSFDGILAGNFGFTKLSTKMEYGVNHSSGSLTSIEVGGDLAFGDVPLMQSFHAFPNSPNKDAILDRFSVAGIKSFETMYFNEFFSTKLATLHLKHRLAPFKISNTIQPELVFISRHALGDFDNPENHQGVTFNTLSKGYNEAGLELNKIFYGFGLSFAYRYGAYHLPDLEDNISFKFTFYLKL